MSRFGKYLVIILVSLILEVVGRYKKACKGSNQANVPFSMTSFPLYPDLCNFSKRAPAWIVSNSSQNSIHRFFDSSPFSPSGIYIAMVEFPTIVDTLHRQITAVKIMVVNLKTGFRREVATTRAWASQVGAHVQWGATDSQLFYNILLSDGTIHGVKHDIFNQQRVTLDCAIYHVSSSGRFAISPNLHKIKYTQKGYGIDVDDMSNRSAPNTNAPLNDGLFMVDTESGSCTLLASLADFAKSAALDTQATPTYGFHAKWSSDDQRILFVVRTLESSNDGFLGMFRPKKTIRVQHLFTLHVDGSNIRHVVSWSSKYPGDYVNRSNNKNTVDASSFMMSKRCFVDRIGTFSDGNHPNWIPGTYKVSMNLDVPTDELRNELKLSHKNLWPIAIFDLNASSLLGSDCKLTETHDSSGGPFGNSDCTGPHMQREPHTSGHQQCNGIHRFWLQAVGGSGHPHFSPIENGTKFVILDAYSKEIPLFPMTGGDGNCAPLRIADVTTGQESWLLQVD